MFPILFFIQTFSLCALKKVTKFIDQRQFKGPCGCIALECAARYTNQTKAVRHAIARARRAKKDLTCTTDLFEIACVVGLLLQPLTLIEGQPMALGYIEYQAHQTPIQVRRDKVKKIIADFKHSSQRFLHFMCCMKAQIDHGFLITIDKKRNILFCHEDIFSRKNPQAVVSYVKFLKQWYEHA